MMGVLLMVSASVSADALLFVSPLRVEMKPGEDSAVITITNKSDTTRRYKVEMTDQVMNAEGVVETAETFPYSSKRMLRFMPRRVVLEAGQRQVVRVMARRPADLPDGDYHTHLLFEEEQPAATASAGVSGTEAAKGLTFALGTTYGVAIPLMVQHGVVSSSIALTDARLKQTVEGKPTDVLAAFHRGGNAEASGMVTVTSGDTNLVTPRRVRLYREVDDVVITLPLNEAGAAYHGQAVVRLTDGAETAPKILREMTVTFP